MVTREAQSISDLQGELKNNPDTTRRIPPPSSGYYPDNELNTQTSAFQITNTRTLKESSTSSNASSTDSIVVSTCLILSTFLPKNVSNV